MTIKNKEFVELEFSGYANGELFDSTKLDEIKKLNPRMQNAKPMIVSVGQGMILPAFDKAIEGKELEKEYQIEIKAKDAFGERRRELVKMIPLSAFEGQRVMPQAGMSLMLDNNLVKVLSVSGGRVTLDFNNPLAGKDIKYTFKIKRIVEDLNEKTTALFDVMFRFVPKFEIKDKIVITGPKLLEHYAKSFSPKFKDLVGKELDFIEEKVEKKENKVENKEEKENN